MKTPKYRRRNSILFLLSLGPCRDVVKIALVALLFSGAGALAEPLNSGFEIVSGSFATDWTKTNQASYVTMITTPSSTTTWAGNNSVKISDTSSSNSAGALSSPIPIIAGRKYVASVKCRMYSGTVASLYLQYRDDSGNVLSGHSYSQNCQAVTGDWQTITVIPEDPTTKQVLAAPSGATNVTLLVYSPQSQNGVTYFDNALLTEVANVPVPNASFETLSGGFPVNWEKPYANGYETSSTTLKYLDGRSLKIDDTSSSLGGGVRSDPIPVIPGRQYIANIKCYIQSGTTVSLYLQYWNSEGTKMLSYSTDVKGTGSWQNITVTPEEPVTRARIVAPYGASYLTIMAYSPQGQNGVSYFDAVQLLVNNIDFATSGVVAANSSFEDVDGGGFPLEWLKYGYSNFESGSSAKSSAGSRSVRINDTSASENGGVESKAFPVIEGKSYVMAGKYFIESASANPDFRIYIRYFDNEGDLTPKSYTPDEYLTAESVAVTTTGSWQDVSFEFTPPFLAKYATILIYSSQSARGDAYFDSISVAPTAAGLSNGNFEDWSLSGYPHSWTATTNSANVVTSGSTTRFSGIARSLKVVDTSSGEGGGARSNRITGVEVGKSYTASGKFYVESGSLDLYIEYWNTSGSRIGVDHSSVTSTGSWQPVSVSLSAPTGTTYATVLIYSSTGGTSVAYADEITFTSDVVAVSDRRQLFIDDYVIKSLTGMSKVVNPGTIENGGNPVLTNDKAWETDYMLCYGSLVYDDVASNYRLYYTSYGRTLYAVSSNGESGWTKPNLGVFSYNGSTNNNIVVDQAANPDEGSVGLGIVINPNEADPNKKYRAFGKWHYITGDPTGRPAWYQMFSSSDGKTFKNPIDVVNGWDVGTMAYDTENSQFVASAKYFDNIRRVHRMTTSSDGSTWTVPVRNESLADTVDTLGHLESDSYGLGWYPYEGVYVGFNWIFQIDAGLDLPPGEQNGLVTPQLVFSRDLKEDWLRVSRIPIIPRGANGTWNDGLAYTASYAVTKGDRVLLYFSASNMGHFPLVTGATCKIGLATWRLDGFVSVESGATEGTLLSKKLIFSGSSLKLNLNSSGSGNYAKVELLNSLGSVISGFSKADCDSINTDNVNATVTWNGSSNISSLSGQTIQVKIYSKNTKLYALQFE